MNESKELLNYLPDIEVLAGKVILVTGAGAGIGRAISKAYAQFGATVVLLDKTIKELEAVYDEIVDAGWAEPAIYPLNMEGANARDYDEMAGIFQEKLGGLDGIALNAAWLPAFIPFKDYDVELWSKTITVNLHANFLITHACLPLLEQSADPAIVISAHHSRRAYNGAFGIAKAGMEAMMDILVDEYDNDNNFIRINSIDTGPLRTQMRKRSFPAEDIEQLARPESIVGPYLYYMGADAKQRTGEKIVYERLPAETRWPGQLD